MLPYNRKNISRAKELRKGMTRHEKRLWYDYLRNYPIRFQRQKAIGEFIADFYCAKAHLVIELDGSGHYSTEEQEAYDAFRTAELAKLNLRVMRFTNLQIDENFCGVCNTIDRAVKESLPQSAVG